MSRTSEHCRRGHARHFVVTLRDSSKPRRVAMENLPTTHDAVSAPYTGPHRANPTTRVPFATPEPTCAHRRNSRKCYGSELRPPPAPLPPNVAGEVLNGDEISFLDFITDERFRGYLQLL